MPMTPGLIFNAEEIIYKKTGLGFEDVTLVPQYSDVSSQNPPTLKTRISKNVFQDIPILSSNMDTITEYAMAQAMMKCGGAGVIHRYQEIDEQVKMTRELKFYKTETHSSNPIIASVGVREEEKKRAEALAQEGIDCFCLDIAHGDSLALYKFLEYLKVTYPSIDVIAGNVSSADGVRRMIEHGADGIKVGIGVGSLSLTRELTGHGVPALTGIALANSIASKYDIPIIADGGLSSISDIVKAICAGADAVMLGFLIAGSNEAAAKENQMKQKTYRGVSSLMTQESWVGDRTKFPERESKQMLVSSKGPVENIVSDICNGLKLAMGLVGAHQVDEMVQKALFMQLRSRMN